MTVHDSASLVIDMSDDYEVGPASRAGTNRVSHSWKNLDEYESPHRLWAYPP